MTGKVVPGYTREDCQPLSGDNVNQPVQWKAHQTLPEGGSKIQLRFFLRNASLYSFNIASSAE